MRMGIDIGGTKANLALVDDAGKILKRRQLPTGNRRSCREVMTLVALAAKELAGDEMPGFVGMGVPGTVDGSRVLVAPNLHWRNEPAADFFFEAAGIMPFLAQDTRAAAWGEARSGIMREKKCLVCVTLGTGIGCGIVMNHHIWHGALGTAGEIGHTTVVPGGRLCGCGRRGCMEAYASGTGMAKIAAERGICGSSEALFRLAGAGNTAALQVIDEATGYAAMAISSLINLISPDAVLFSGGLSAQDALFVQPLIRKIRAGAYEIGQREELYLGPAILGPDAPVIGAAFLDEA